MRHTAKGLTVADPPATPAPTTERLPDADHWVLGPSERAEPVRPVRTSYIHLVCGGDTRMPRACAETYARQPSYYGSTFCCWCRDYFPVGAPPTGQFVWKDSRTDYVGT